MSETIKSIIEWHEQTFPDATLEGQLEKFDDEVKEFWGCELLSEDAATELADCFIVACGIARFNNVEAIKAFSFVVGYLLNDKELTQMFNIAIDKKMAINRKRKWGIGKGNYQHIEEGGEE